MFTFLSDSLLLIVPQLLWQCPGIVARGAAVRGGAGRRAKPGEEIDYGMPITDPAVMIPLIGVIIMVTAIICRCCIRMISGDEDTRKNTPAEGLQLKRKTRSHSRSPKPEVGFMKNGAIPENQNKSRNGTKFKEQERIANLKLDDLPYDCYKPVVKAKRQAEQIV